MLAEFIIKIVECIPSSNEFYNCIRPYLGKIAGGITFIGIIARFINSKKLENKFDNSPVNLVNEFYFFKEMVSNWGNVPKSLKKLALYNLGKIVSKGKSVSYKDEMVIKFLFENYDKRVELLTMYFQTDKLIFKEGTGLSYKKCYFWVKSNKPNKFSQYLYTFLYFILAIIALLPSFIHVGQIEPFKYVIFIIVWAVIFLTIAFMSLVRFSKFYWANKLLNEIHSSKEEKND